MVNPLAPNSALELIASRHGRYTGHGSNEVGHAFTAELELNSQVAGAVVELKFRALDQDSAFHEELTWITPDLRTDKLCLWTVSTNTPGVLCHVLVEDRQDDFRERRFVFRMGEPDQMHSFRQEIVLDLMKDGRLEYRYSWGVPHEKFGPRVHAKLERSQS